MILRFPQVLFFLFLALFSGCDSQEPTANREARASLPTSVIPRRVDSLATAKILVFSKTLGWRHDSIPEGIATFEKMAAAEKFSIVATEDSSIFNDTDLKQFNAIVFLNTTLDVLDKNQEAAMERYIQAGGGFVGIHSATDTEWEGDWFWFRNLVGAVFKNHPSQPSNVQNARLVSLIPGDPLLENIPHEFSLADEWYNYRDLYEGLEYLMEVDEKTYQGGEHGEHHPVAWVHEYDGGRAFYTGLGHSKETFQNPVFQQLLLNGLKYAVAKNYREQQAPDLKYDQVKPQQLRFVKKTYIEKLNEPVKFDFFPNGDALIALRPGELLRVEKDSGKSQSAGKLDLTFISFLEIGLVGVAVDPEFPEKPFVYLVYSKQDEKGQLYQRLSRFEFTENQLQLKTEKMILQHAIDNNCCHTGGDLAFADNRILFYSTGDNTNPHDQDGYAPMDFRPDFQKNDALRSAGNSQDLRGKILRIAMEDDGSYKIPEGNLFTDAKQGRPEIYVMGARNPYSITWDSKYKQLWFSDVGPDAGEDSDRKGVRGYDEINRVAQAGNFGWPLVIGQNKPYRIFDYVKQEPQSWVDPAAPKNNSPRNTGLVDLPAAQSAFIAYPYATSDLFPEMGTGGRSALVADVYDYQKYQKISGAYPEYYDGQLFILDFMRAWVKVVDFNNQNGRIYKIDSFAPQIQYALPIDAKFGPDGNLYLLEYGMSWFEQNPDARFSKIAFVEKAQEASDQQDATKSVTQGHQEFDPIELGKTLVNANNCLACHNPDEDRIGPAFKNIAKKYQQDPNALNYLSQKIEKGGSGVWGAQAMPSFAGLSAAERQSLAAYVLSFTQKN